MVFNLYKRLLNNIIRLQIVHQSSHKVAVGSIADASCAMGRRPDAPLLVIDGTAISSKEKDGTAIILGFVSVVLRCAASSSRGRGRGGTGDFERKASWIRHVVLALSPMGSSYMGPTCHA